MKQVYVNFKVVFCDLDNDDSIAELYDPLEFHCVHIFTKVFIGDNFESYRNYIRPYRVNH